MKTQHTPQPSAIKSPVMSSATRKRLNALADKLKGRELFPEKIERARQAVKSLTALPI